MAEDTDSVGNQTESAETPNEAYKSLQRKLEASRRRERALMEQNLAQVEIQAQLEALTHHNQAVLKVLEKSGLIEDDEFPKGGGIRAEVERRLASRAGASMVDSEGTTSVVPTGLLTDASRLNNTLAGPEGREFWTEHKDEILKNLRGGKISLPA